MLRRLIVFSLLTLPLSAALWPDRFSEYSRESAGPASLDAPAVWAEYGLEETEVATYVAPAGSFKAAAYRLKDPTSALAVYQWKVPANAQPSELHEIAAETSSNLYLVIGNYFITFEGRKPTIEELQELTVVLPRMDFAALPALIGFLPKENLVPGSSRFVIGPASLAQFEPRIPPSVAAFSMAAEAQLGRFNSPKGELNLAIFSYPTPQIARERLAEFEKLGNVVAKRSGPLVAVTLNAPDPDEAERLLARVNYRANLTRAEAPPGQEQSVADFLITVFVFIGVLVGFTLVAGAGYAGMRMAYRKWAGIPEDGGMLTLHLEDK